KLKFLIPSSLLISSPTPLKTIMPDPPKFSEAIKMTLDQFTKHLSKPHYLSSLLLLQKSQLHLKIKLLSEINPKEKEPLSREKVMAQLKEMKRLADLKAEKKKSEKFLKKILNPTTIRA
ncbi:hypothetical protein Tco_0203407, partial [Tanacetum coccineum]